METKQVIIQNKTEEKQFLEEAERRGYKWAGAEDEPPTRYTPSLDKQKFPYLIKARFDYLLYVKDHLKEFSTLSQFLESVDN
jgi:hypothetical protein